MRRRALVVTAAVFALGVPAGLADAAPDGSGPRAGRSSEVPGPAAGDQDHDHVSDDFESRLRTAGPAERLAVIVTGFGPDRARRAVGAFRLAHDLPLIDGFAATMTAAQARGLLRVPGLRRVEADGPVHALDEATNADYGATATREAHPGYDGSGVGICVIDTGVDPNHEQISPRQVTFVDYVNGRAAAYDDQGHGTHVASIAAGDGTGGADAARFVGVAPAADLYAAKVLDSTGYGVDSDIVAAVQWCASKGDAVDVISMSIGGGAGDGTDASSLAIDNAVAGGDVAVIAGGNSGDEPGTINAPGLAAQAITVGAASDYSAPVGTDYHDDGIWLAAFSSRGPVRQPDGTLRVEPEVTAPGVSVRAAQANTAGGYITQSGTSMATPFVAGAVALALDAAPAATPAQIRSALVGTAVDVGAAGPDNEWGAGLIDVQAFVDAVVGDQVTRTPFPARQRVTGAVPNGGSASFPVTIEAADLGVPLAVTLTVDGQAVCYWGCLVKEWSPDLDLRLTDPAGVEVARSECALSGLSCGIGRQETIGFTPTTAGTYTLHVDAFTGSPNNGQGGSFSADVFHGPLAGAAPPPPASNQPPVVEAGADQALKVARKAKKATFTLDGSQSYDPDGTIASWRWTQGSTVVGTTSKVTLSRGPGTYVFSLTATDDDGATGSDSTTVTVTR